MWACSTTPSSMTSSPRCAPWWPSRRAPCSSEGVGLALPVGAARPAGSAGMRNCSYASNVSFIGHCYTDECEVIHEESLIIAREGGRQCRVHSYRNGEPHAFLPSSYGK